MEGFVSSSISLLLLEREAELSRGEVIISAQLQQSKLLESKGNCLLRLKVADQSVGLYGKHIVSFQCMKPTEALPSTSISSGDIVGVFSKGKSVTEKTLSGVVTAIKSTSLSVVFDELPDTVDLSTFDGSIQLVKLCNDVTYRRMRRCLEEMKSSVKAYSLISVLFGTAPLAELDPRYSSHLKELTEEPHSRSSYPFINTSLNRSQQEAVLFALSRKDIAIVHGPPGTGKTTTVVEIILQSIKLGHKILACAPSNLAVDNLVEKLGTAKAKIVRIGHPARIVEAVQKYSLDALLSTADSAGIILDVRKDLQSAIEHCMKSRTSSERRRWRNDVKYFKRELLKREEKSIKELLGNAEVILSTINGASPEGSLKYLDENHFDLVVIDECAQAIEPSCWIAVLRAPRCILAGDDKQLPPTILSHEASKGLSLTMMERLHKLYGKAVTATLTTQYRMHQDIMSWPSMYLYNNLLEADSSVACHLLSGLQGVEVTTLTSIPLLFIDTAGCDMTELDTADEESKGNEGEADLVLHYLKKLDTAGVPLNLVAVITPYNLQVDLIRQRLPLLGRGHENVEVHTVDGFQGREKEAVIISFTRSNKKGEYGFLQEMRRTNVAMTRARRHLALIGDSVTISNEPFIKGMIAHCHEHGEVHSAHDYINDDDFEEGLLYKPTRPVAGVPENKVVAKKNSSLSRSRQSPAKAPNTVHVRVDSVPDEQTSLVSSIIEVTAECRQKYTERLKCFMESEQTILKFPSSLSGNERKCIHQICEEIGLLHESRDQGKERHIVVTKPSTEMEAEDSRRTKSAGVEVSCSSCGKATPEGDIEFHSCKPKVSVMTEPSVAKGSKMKSIAARKKKCPMKKESEDLDTMLAEMTLLDSSCSFHGCKKKVNLLGLQCHLCHRRFCMEHNIPEVHGCSEAAKKHARQAVRPSSTSSSKERNKRAQLQKKLGSKLEELSSERKSKTKIKSKT